MEVNSPTSSRWPNIQSWIPFLRMRRRLAPSWQKNMHGEPWFLFVAMSWTKLVANNSVDDHYSWSWTSKWGSRARKQKQNLMLHDHDKWSRTVKFCSWPQSMVMNQIIFFMTILIGHEPNKLLHDQEHRLWTHGMS